MAQQSRALLKSNDENVYLPDNITQLIVPLGHRTSNSNSYDSSPNFIDEEFSYNLTDKIFSWNSEPLNIERDPNNPNVPGEDLYFMHKSWADDLYARGILGDETVAGQVQFATLAEVVAGVNDTKVFSPLKNEQWWESVKANFNIISGAWTFNRPGTNDAEPLVEFSSGAGIHFSLRESGRFQLGAGAVSTLDTQVVIGKGASSDILSGIAIGNNAQAITEANGIAIGESSLAQSSQSIAIGDEAANTTGIHNDQVISIGAFANRGAHDLGRYGIAIGNNAITKTTGQISIGQNAASNVVGATGNNVLSIGYQVNTGADAIGSNVVALGYLAYTRGQSSISIGAQAGRTSGTHGSSSIIIGDKDHVSNQDKNIGGSSIAIGAESTAEESNSQVYGGTLRSTAVSAIIMGNGVSVNDRLINSEPNSWAWGTGTEINIHFIENGDSFIRNTNGLVLGSDTLTASAKLEVAGTDGAFLLPRMTTAQRDSLTASNGMFIYNTTLEKLQGYENGAWVNLI